MDGAETLDILSEIQSLVSDKLQVVSYKWVSRNFSVSSNDAKRMLQEFVEQRGSGLKVVYVLSGWLKKSPLNYKIKLTTALKLSETKKEFEDNCSIQIYSVQESIPKDPATLWNYEFVQAEELFDQPATNCLRDNRFCGVSNSFVKCNATGRSSIVAPPQTKSTNTIASSKNNITPTTPGIQQQLHGKVQQPSPKIGVSTAALASTVKKEPSNSEANDQDGKSLADKDKATSVPANKKNAQAEKSSSTAGSLSNLWNRASAKAKPSPPAETIAPNITDTADAQIHAHEATDAMSSDDEASDINYKRSSNGEGSRKRRVVIDFSDEENDEDVVNLASPDPPKRKSGQDSKYHITSLDVEKSNVNLETQKEGHLEIKKEKITEKEPSPSSKENQTVQDKGKNTGISLSVKSPSLIPDSANQMSKVNEASSNSPKRRKVLKTRIDDRGREVTEVVWEGEEAQNKNTDESSTIADASNTRPPAVKKSPALPSNAASNAMGKAGTKKTGKAAGTKDPKQGNIMSFFKKV